ncbi:MAG: hypothetical protein MRY74_11635 [Neomegalonema sp.]|nr:hypothetical protein [Neomegalonema sp.]
MPIAEFRFEYRAADKSKPNPNLDAALETVRGVLSDVSGEQIKRELFERTGAQVEVTKKVIHDKPLALNITFDLVESVRHRHGNVVQIYRALQAVERRTDEYLYYLIRGARENGEWFAQSGLKRSSGVVSTAGFINKTERISRPIVGFWYGGALGALLTAYGFHFALVNAYVLKLLGKG